MSPRERERTPSGVSLDPDDAVATSLGLGPGPAIGKSFIFDWFDFKKKGERKAVLRPCLIVEWTRDDEREEVPYGVGDGWDISKDGLELIPKKGQTGLNTNCGAYKLLESLKGAGMPKGFITAPDVLDGIEVVLEQEAEDKNSKEKRRSLLLVAEVIDAPWDKDFQKKGKGGKAAAKDSGSLKRGKVVEDEEEEERPARGSRRRPAVEEDESDEKPKRGRKAPVEEEDEEAEVPVVRGRGGKQAVAAESEDLDADAIEAIIAALENSDGPIKLKDLEDAVLDELKGNKQAKAIAAVAVEPDFLDSEKGWSFNGKVIELAAKPARGRR